MLSKIKAQEIATSIHEIARFSPNECVNIAISCALVWTHTVVIRMYLSRIFVRPRTQKKIFFIFFVETIECVVFVSTLRIGLSISVLSGKYYHRSIFASADVDARNLILVYYRMSGT